MRSDTRVFSKRVMSVRIATILSCPLFLTGCGVITACTYEERSITAAGVIVENGVEVVNADVNVSGLRGGLEWKSFNRTIKGTLKGHVLSINLIRSDDPAAFQLALPLDEASSPFISTGGMQQRPGEDSPVLGGIYEIFDANLGVLEITTDLPSQSRILLPLVVTFKQDWFRPHNCY
jgi:hypothetical protein